MIRAVVRYARNEGEYPLPPILAMARRCREWHCLPVSGGERDQPVGILDRMTASINIYEAVSAYERSGRKAGEMAKWRNENPERAAIIDRLKKDGAYE